MFIRTDSNLRDWKPLVLPDGVSLDLHLKTLLENEAYQDSDSGYKVSFEIDKEA